MSISLWDKIDHEVARQIATDGVTSNAAVEGLRKKTNWRRLVRVGDIAGSVLWMSGLVKLFIFDFDSYLANQLGPTAQVIVSFRSIIFIVIIAILISATRKSWFVIGYVGVFPILVIAWKVPRLLIRLKSWNFLLALLTLTVSIGHRFRRRFLVRAFEIVMIVLFLMISNKYFAITCAVIFAILLGYHFAQTVIASLRASRFLSAQKGVLTSVFSEDLPVAAKIDDQLRDAEVQVFSKDQLQKFVNSVSTGLVTVKMVAFYAFLLRRYKRSVAPALLAILSYAWLFVQSVILLTLTNYAIWKWEPSQFVTQGSPNAIRFVYYSLTALYGNTVPQVTADGTAALVVATVAAFYGPILVISCGATVFISLKQTSNDAAFEDVLLAMRARERELTRRLEEEYGVGPDEAIRRLHEFGIGLGAVWAYIARVLPSDQME